MKHFPKQICQLPKFDGAFDAFKLEAKNCDVLIEFWFHTTPAA